MICLICINHLHHHLEIQVADPEKSEGTLIAGDYIGRFVPGDARAASHQPHVFRNDENTHRAAGR